MMRCRILVSVRIEGVGMLTAGLENVCTEVSATRENSRLFGHLNSKLQIVIMRP